MDVCVTNNSFAISTKPSTCTWFCLRQFFPGGIFKNSVNYSFASQQRTKDYFTGWLIPKVFNAFGELSKCLLLIIVDYISWWWQHGRSISIKLKTSALMKKCLKLQTKNEIEFCCLCFGFTFQT